MLNNLVLLPFQGEFIRKGSKSWVEETQESPLSEKTHYVQ